MLQPEPMRELTLLIPKSDERRAIEALADAKLLHVHDHERALIQGVTIDIGTPSGDATALADALLKTRALIMATGAEASSEPGSRTIAERIARVKALAARVAEHERTIADAQARLAALRQRATLLSSLPPVEGEVRALAVSRTVAGILVENASEPVMRAMALEDPVARIDAPDGRTLLVVRKADLAATAARLKSCGATTDDLAPLADATGTIEDAQRRTAAEIAALERRIAAERNGIADTARHAGFLRATERVLALELLKAQAPLRFGETRRVALIRGWVPESRSEELLARMRGVRHVADLTVPDDAPTLLRNPRPAKGFEALLAMYSLPRYREIDPTSVMAITFPVFFGFMLGDIGYGLLILLLAFLLARRPALRPFAEIIGISAMSAVLFGALFGELFGLGAIGAFSFPSLLHRAEDPMTLGLIALAFGVAHMNLGLLFGLVTACRKDGIAHGVISKGGWFAVEAGIAMLLLGRTAWWVPAGLGVIALAWGEGIVGIVEIPTLVTHTLSYLRLAAIGLASVFLAVVTNTLGGGLVSGGGWGILGGSIILIVGHSINLALGLFGPFLHSLRLHYAEFFMKFYEGGGRPYVPFGTGVEA